jgi:predicted nuclease with RNAse H fold/dephospho-CoA kinase
MPLFGPVSLSLSRCPKIRSRRILRRSFPIIRFPHVHIDLRFLARRVGLRGGQKNIEQEIGFLRPSIVRGLEGDLAPVLWQRFRRGSADALRQLVAYNLADIDGMKAILDEIVARLQATGELPATVPVPRFSASPTHASSDQVFQNITLPKPPVSGAATSYSSLFPKLRRRSIRVLGVDLVAAETRASGWALLSDSTVVTGLVRSDTEVMELLERTRPDLVSIDAPLSLPKGRVSVEDSDPGRYHFGITRACERILFRRGVRVYPALIRSMQGLTRRGMGLAQALRARGIPVIESFPGAAQDILQIPRKHEGLDLLKQGIKDFGIDGDFTRPEVTHDEIDAITSALVGVFFWENRYEALGNETEDFLIVPDLKVSPPRQVVVGISGAIAAGKTTVSRYIETRGFFYIRFSQVIDRLITEKGLPLDRVHRQLVGEQVNRSPGQRWLCQELLRLVPQDVTHIVVDGLRFPEDHAFLSERFRSRFTHMHIVAGEDIRQARYALAGLTAQEFFSAEHAWTEKHHRLLASLAHYTVINESDLEALHLGINKILVADHLRVEGSQWQ